MAPQFDDLPPEAAKAIRLADAFCQYADGVLIREYRYTKKQLRAEGKWQYFGSSGGVEGYVLTEFGGSSPELGKEARELTLKIETGFVSKLRRGQLTAWAREGSPLARWCEIPASAWSVFWPDKLHKGIVKGGGVELFDVRVGPRAPVPPLPTTGAPGRPSHMHLVEAEFHRRVEEGETEPDLRDEASALHAWFKAHHPDKQAMTAKTIGNRLRPEHRKLRTCK